MRPWDELYAISRRDPTVAAALILIRQEGRSHDTLLRLAVLLAREKDVLLRTAQRAAQGLPVVAVDAPDLAGYSRSIREADSPDEAQGLLREAADYLDESDLERLRALAVEKFPLEEIA